MLRGAAQRLHRDGQFLAHGAAGNLLAIGIDIAPELYASVREALSIGFPALGIPKLAAAFSDLFEYPVVV